MTKSKNMFVIITSIVLGLLLLRFALSKILGETEAVNQFIEMAKPININPTLFRISSGVILFIISIAYLINSGILMIKQKLHLYLTKIYLLGGITMLGAIASEFLLRSSPKYPLVFLAILIISFSIVNFFFLSKSQNNGIKSS